HEHEDRRHRGDLSAHDERRGKSFDQHDLHDPVTARSDAATREEGPMTRLLGERGSMAVIAILGMALLLVITVAFVALAQLETKIGVNHAQEVQATQAAEAGARRVYRAIADGSDTGATWVTNTATTPVTGT